jgi:hypothetical protein
MDARAHIINVLGSLVSGHTGRRAPMTRMMPA